MKPQQVSPNFQIGSDAWQANELLIESFLIEETNPQFCPSLRDIMDNSIRLLKKKKTHINWHTRNWIDTYYKATWVL